MSKPFALTCIPTSLRCCAAREATFLGAKHPNADLANLVLYYIHYIRSRSPAAYGSIRNWHGSSRSGVSPTPPDTHHSERDGLLRQCSCCGTHGSQLGA
jgi:hypothetical protein